MSNEALPMVQLNFKYVNGLHIEINGATTLTIAAGQCRDESDSFQILNNSVIEVNAINVGENGIDKGALANNALYGVYVISDPIDGHPTKGLLSLDGNIPTMPFQYRAYRLIGFVRTNGSAEFVGGKFAGNGSDRTFVYDVPVATSITAGAATAYTNVSLAGLVPASVQSPVALLDYDLTPSAAGRAMSLQSFGSDAAGQSVVVTGQVAAVHVTGVAEVIAGDNAGVPTVRYKWSAGGGDAVALSVSGYKYSL